MTQAEPIVLASFLASLVEFVEALTVLLAVGSVRGWRWPLAGAGAALLVLLALALCFGRAVMLVPLDLLRLGVGTLLLLFGLRWLRKAILRAAGIIPLHDEDQAFAREAAAMRRRGASAGGWDAVAFGTCFEIVMLEGLEVLFIVIAVGAGGFLLPAGIGALAALGVVSMLGVMLHRPLARIPENPLKFTVGVILSAFGTFWVGEGLGIHWPGGDGSVVWLVGGFLAVAATGLCLVRVVAKG
jgi:uncharacterized membrane protein